MHKGNPPPTHTHTSDLILFVSCFSLHELLRHNHNGLVFNDHTELAEQLLVRLDTIIILHTSNDSLCTGVCYNVTPPRTIEEVPLYVVSTPEMRTPL